VICEPVFYKSFTIYCKSTVEYTKVWAIGQFLHKDVITGKMSTKLLKGCAYDKF
jgi:cytochrome oxidase assembly protein ShyY1